MHLYSTGRLPDYPCKHSGYISPLQNGLSKLKQGQILRIPLKQILIIPDVTSQRDSKQAERDCSHLTELR